MAIELDVVTQLNERSALTAARQAHAHWERASRTTGDTVQRNLGGGFDRTARDAERSATQMQRAFNRVADASGRVRLEQERYDTLIRSGESDRVKLIRQSERLATARRAEQSATRTAASAHRDYDRSIRDLGDAFTRPMANASAFSGTLTELGTTMGRLGPVVGGAAIVGIGGALVQLGSIAASAAQSLWLLPGALGAVGVAFGTVKLATAGLDDAFSNIGDPEKFAESLRNLAPSAQQFMLSIQGMMPAFDQLKTATQGAFFDGFGEQANRLVNQYLPTIQQATTDVASSFNQMFSGVADQLMTPQTQQAIQEFLNNVSSAFQQLAPAAAPLTRALGDIMAVGSGVLPQLAQAATNAAQSFAAFISEARASGDLQRWLSEGLDTMRELGQIAWGLGQAFMSLAPMAREILPTIRDLLTDIQTIMPAIGAAAMVVGVPIGLWAVGIDNAARALEGITTVVEGVGNAVIPVINRIGQALSDLLAPVRNQLNRMIEAANHLPGVDISPIGEFTPINQLGEFTPTQGGLPGAQAQRRGGTSAFSLPGAGLPGAPEGGWGMPSAAPGWGLPMPAAPAGVSGWNPRAVYQDQLQERISGSGGGRSLPQAPSLPLEYSSTAGMTASLAAAQNRVDETRHAVAERQARLNQLLASNVADENAIQDARNDVARAEQDAHEAQMRFADAQQKAAESQSKNMRGLTGGLNELGAALDSDLGVSGGLAGMADNLVHFLGAIALAGPMAHLSAISDARGDEGSGLVGILASTGALGPQFLPGQATASNMGPAALRPSGSYPGDAALLANVPAGRYTQEARGDLTQGLADCSSAVEDLVNLMDGRPTGGASMSTHNAAQWLTERGFLPGLGGLGDFRVGFNSGHMQATLPGGTPFNWGSDAAAARGGVGGTGADDPAFTDHYYRPAGAGFSAGLPALPSTSAPGLPSSGGGTVPVFVVNMPGGGVGSVNLPIGPGGPAAPTGGPAGPAAPSIGPAPLGGSVGAPLASPGALPGLYGPANTNPGLNNPAAPGAALPPLGSLPGGGSLLPGTGMPGAAPLSSGGQAYPAQPGGGGIGLGGMAMDGLMAATSGLDMMAPGAGAAAKIGIQLANLGIKQAGKVAGIATSGVFETLSLGDNPMGSLGKSWIGKFAGGLAGARPAVPNAAGQAAPAMASDKDPRAAMQRGAEAVKGGDTNISVTNNRLTEDGQGRDIAWHVNSPPGRQG